MTAGSKYTVSAKICAADLTSSGTVVKFVLSGGEVKYGSEKAIIANTFTQVSETFTASANTGLEIDLGFINGRVYIDDVSVVAEGSSANLVSNGDFEVALSTEGWAVPGYTAQTIGHAEQAQGEVALGAQKVTIGSTGYATMVAFNPLRVPADVNAYFAKYDSEKGNVKLTPETTLPQWGRAVLHGTPDDYYFPQISAGDVTANWSDSGLEVSWGDIIGDGSTIYALGEKGGVVGFVKVKSGVTIPSGKAYLVVSSSARDFIGFGDDDTTDIKQVESSKMNIEGYFNLAGQRVAQPTKGLYIVNGKKVIVK